jgi:hypothetical protein
VALTSLVTGVSPVGCCSQIQTQRIRRIVSYRTEPACRQCYGPEMLTSTDHPIAALLGKWTWTRGVTRQDQAQTCFGCGLRFSPVQGHVNVLTDETRAFRVKVCAACADQYAPSSD